MFKIYCVIILIVYTIAILLISHYKKQNYYIHKTNKELEFEKFVLKQDIKKFEDKLTEAYAKYCSTYQDYSQQLVRRKQEISESCEELEKEKKDALNARVANYEQECNYTMRQSQLALEDKLLEYNEQIENLDKLIAVKQADYEGLLAPLKTLEKERQDKLFYCIQITEEDERDIEYLVEEVVPHVKHKDVICKLIWSEFIKTPLDLTLKRVGVNDMPGIYKITNIDNGMCYVGKSTNVKKRLQDHFKSVVGISTIADQHIHHEILKYGIGNWMIEQICECDKEELNQKEKFYIDTFNAQGYGYNLKAGG